MLSDNVVSKQPACNATTADIQVTAAVYACIQCICIYNVELCNQQVPQCVALITWLNVCLGFASLYVRQTIVVAGYVQVMPAVYCGLFPTDAEQFEPLREALGRLQLNDAALQFEPEVSSMHSGLAMFQLTQHAHNCTQNSGTSSSARWTPYMRQMLL